MYHNAPLWVRAVAQSEPTIFCLYGGSSAVLFPYKTIYFVLCSLSFFSLLIFRFKVLNRYRLQNVWIQDEEAP